MVQHDLVTIETGYGNTAEKIENQPFIIMSIQVPAIGIDIGESEFMDAALQALADLPAHLSKSRPTHTQLRQCPPRHVARCVVRW